MLKGHTDHDTAEGDERRTQGIMPMFGFALDSPSHSCSICVVWSSARFMSGVNAALPHGTAVAGVAGGCIQDRNISTHHQSRRRC